MDLLKIAARVACLADQPCPKAPEGLTREGVAQAIRERMEGIELNVARLRQTIASMLERSGGMTEEEWRETMAKVVQEIRISWRTHRECEVLLRRVLREPWDERLLKLGIP